ncbi:MAG: zf-HC2 domain-containing protein [Deferribacteres bacterium]|nr:zf-HC2 domain-containing protein [Deferribacteres bacterium]
MGLSHNEIKDRLPEYLGKASMPEEVSEHLKTCPECREEFSLLRAMKKDHPPEPDGMFFETLSQRVRAQVHEKHEKKKRTLPGFIPRFAFAAILVAVLAAGYFYHTMHTQDADELYAFSDPDFFPGGRDYDLSALTPDDIPSIAGDIEEGDVYLDEDSFLRELAYMGPGEMDMLYEELKIKDTNGGVL